MELKKLESSEDSDEDPIPLSEIYSTIVYDCGVDPNYFLDKMDWHEVVSLYQHHAKREENRLHELRWAIYPLFAVQSPKQIKIEKVWPLPSDKPTIISKEDIKKSQKKTLEMHKRFLDRESKANTDNKKT